MLDSTARLAIAEFVIYMLLLPIVIFILIRHGKPGIFGWLFLIVFCAMRITSSGLQIGNSIDVSHGKPGSSTAAIVNSVGISPLLVTLAGVISEAAHYASDIKRKTDLIFHSLIHTLIATGIALAAVGGSNLAKPDSSSSDISQNRSLQKAGYMLLLVTVLVIVGYAVFVLLKLRQSGQASKYNMFSQVYWAMAAIAFAAVRVIYGVVYAFEGSKTLSPVTGSFAVKLVLIFLVQLLAALCLIIGGTARQTRLGTQPTQV